MYPLHSSEGFLSTSCIAGSMSFDKFDTMKATSIQHIHVARSIIFFFSNKNKVRGLIVPHSWWVNIYYMD